MSSSTSKEPKKDDPSLGTPTSPNTDVLARPWFGLENPLKKIEAILAKWENDRVVAFKPTATILMDTRDRVNSADLPTNCQINMSFPNKTPGVKKVVLMNYTIPHKWPNINQY